MINWLVATPRKMGWLGMFPLRLSVFPQLKWKSQQNSVKTGQKLQIISYQNAIFIEKFFALTHRIKN